MFYFLNAHITPTCFIFREISIISKAEFQRVAQSITNSKNDQYKIVHIDFWRTPYTLSWTSYYIH